MVIQPLSRAGAGANSNGHFPKIAMFVSNNGASTNKSVLDPNVYCSLKCAVPTLVGHFF